MTTNDNQATPTQDDFLQEASAQISRAGHQRRAHVEINAGELHRVLSGYPTHSHRMASACAALRSLIREGDQVIAEPQSGFGASYTVRFALPRR